MGVDGEREGQRVGRKDLVGAHALAAQRVGDRSAVDYTSMLDGVSERTVDVIDS